MRRVLHGDVASAARRLYAVPIALRERLCRRLLWQAETADRFMRTHQRPHPFWGNGSLMAAARSAHLPPEPGFDNPDYCQCFETVLRQLTELPRQHLKP